MEKNKSFYIIVAAFVILLAGVFCVSRNKVSDRVEEEYIFTHDFKKKDILSGYTYSAIGFIIDLDRMAAVDRYDRIMENEDWGDIENYGVNIKNYRNLHMTKKTSKAFKIVQDFENNSSMMQTAEVTLLTDLLPANDIDICLPENLSKLGKDGKPKITPRTVEINIKPGDSITVYAIQDYVEIEGYKVVENYFGGGSVNIEPIDIKLPIYDLYSYAYFVVRRG